MEDSSHCIKRLRSRITNPPIQKRRVGKSSDLHMPRNFIGALDPLHAQRMISADYKVCYLEL